MYFLFYAGTNVGQGLWFTLFALATSIVALRVGIRSLYGERRLFLEDFLIILAWVGLYFPSLTL